MWDSSHTHTHHTINQIGESQSPPLKSLTSSLGPTLWGSVSEPTRGYQVGSDTICNDPRKSASHICAIPQKNQSQLRLLAVVNKAQFNPVNTQYRTHHTPTHITQSIKLRYHKTFCHFSQKGGENFEGELAQLVGAQLRAQKHWFIQAVYLCLFQFL